MTCVVFSLLLYLRKQGGSHVTCVVFSLLLHLRKQGGSHVTCVVFSPVKRDSVTKFSTSVFFHESFSPKHLSTSLRPFRIFLKIRGDISRLKVHHRCRWHWWQMEKTFKQKNFNNFVWTTLGSRINIYKNFCLQVHFSVSAAWYCCHYLPPVSTTQAELVAKFAAGVVDTGGKFATGVIDTGVVDTGGAPWHANISANFRKNSKWL